MAFDKMIPSKITEYKIFDVDSKDELIKEAGDLDFPEGFAFDPDFMYMWIRIVSAGQYYGPNKNGDYFPMDELTESFESFNEAHPFKNHKNKNVEDAIGKIVNVRWNPVMKCVEILKGIDKKRAPEIARGYLKGYLTDVSMGCKVPYTTCSICGNKARKKSEFCEHVNRYRLRYLGNGERVFEINHKPKFHDSSTVLNGAERVAKAFFIFDENPKNQIESAFRKAASSGNTIHFKPRSAEAMEKIAQEMDNVHPLLREPTLDKHATDSPMMKKIAEIEKELTGKLLNIVSAPDTKKQKGNEQMLEIIKFLTEERLNEDSLKRIASSVKAIAKENDVDISKAFTALLSVAELMGIEFFPNELHILLRELTDASLNEATDTSVVKDDDVEAVYPADYAKAVSNAKADIDQIKTFDDPSSLLHLYDETAHRQEEFEDNPLSFVNSMTDDGDVNYEPPKRMIKVIRQALDPVSPMRSNHPEHLFPRLSLVMKRHKPIIGEDDVSQDLNAFSNPNTIGDLLTQSSYGMYQNLRPRLKGTRVFKIASDEIDGMEKQAKPGGIKKRYLALGAIPAAFGASAFEKSRRENGRYLSDGENFVADNAGLIAGGTILGGKPLTRAIQNVGKKGKKTTSNMIDKIKDPFTKESNEVFGGLVKVADNLESGDFNAFEGNNVAEMYMKETGATGKQASALKMATLLSYGGMEKEANEILHHYNLPTNEMESFLKTAATYVDDEMEKAAEDFTNNMILSSIGDTSSQLGRSLPGRALDAFVFKKLSEGGSEQSNDLQSEVDYRAIREPEQPSE